MPPLTVMVKPVSMRCNMACGYCFTPTWRRTAPYLTRRDELRHARSPVQAGVCYAEGELSLMFQGGEPTLAGAAFYEKVLQLEERYARPNLKVNNAIHTNDCTYRRSCWTSWSAAASWWA